MAVEEQNGAGFGAEVGDMLGEFGQALQVACVVRKAVTEFSAWWRLFREWWTLARRPERDHPRRRKTKKGGRRGRGRK